MDNIPTRQLELANRRLNSTCAVLPKISYLGMTMHHELLNGESAQDMAEYWLKSLVRNRKESNETKWTYQRPAPPPQGEREHCIGRYPVGLWIEPWGNHSLNCHGAGKYLHVWQLFLVRVRVCVSYLLDTCRSTGCIWGTPYLASFSHQPRQLFYDMGV